MVQTKILLVVSYYHPYNSGVTEYVKRLAEGLVSKGHDVTILTSRHTNIPSEEVIGGVRVKRLPVLFKMSKGVFKPTLLPTLWMMSKDFDIVNIHVPLPEVGFCTLLSRNKNIVVTYHCDLELHHGLLETLIESLYYRSLAIAMPRTKKIVVNDMEYALNSRIRDYKEKIVEIYPPIQPYCRKNPADFRSKYGIKAGEVVVGFLGRLVYEKGLKHLVQAIPFVMERMPNIRFIIAGEGEEIAGGRRHSVKEELIIMTSKFKDKVLFPGFLPKGEIEDFYSACDVLVLPSTAALESFGMVQVEAMLCGTPVVATDRPGVKIPVEKTRMGILVPPKDDWKLAEAIVYALKNKDRFTRPREEILQLFSIEKTINSYEKLFLETKQLKENEL
ncbi:MAG: glycosyltransferase family 4 protein [Candidatus Altiarchaeota archaeon]